MTYSSVIKSATLFISLGSFIIFSYADAFAGTTDLDDVSSRFIALWMIIVVIAKPLAIFGAVIYAALTLSVFLSKKENIGFKKKYFTFFSFFWGVFLLSYLYGLVFVYGSGGKEGLRPEVTAPFYIFLALFVINLITASALPKPKAPKKSDPILP